MIVFGLTKEDLPDNFFDMIKARLERVFGKNKSDRVSITTHSKAKMLTKCECLISYIETFFIPGLKSADYLLVSSLFSFNNIFFRYMN